MAHVRQILIVSRKISDRDGDMRGRPDQHRDSGHGGTGTGGPAGPAAEVPGVGPRSGAASDHSDPLSPLPVPNQSSLCSAPILLPILPYLPLFCGPALSRSFYRSQRPAPSRLCYPLSHSLFTLRSVSIHLLLLSLLFFARMPWQKWVLTVPSPHIPVPPFLFFSCCHCVLQQYMLLLGGDVKSSRNAPCKGKKGDDTISFIVL